MPRVMIGGRQLSSQRTIAITQAEMKMNSSRRRQSPGWPRRSGGPDAQPGDLSGSTGCVGAKSDDVATADSSQLYRGHYPQPSVGKWSCCFRIVVFALWLRMLAFHVSFLFALELIC